MLTEPDTPSTSMAAQVLVIPKKKTPIRGLSTSGLVAALNANAAAATEQLKGPDTKITTALAAMEKTLEFPAMFQYLTRLKQRHMYGESLFVPAEAVIIQGDIADGMLPKNSGLTWPSM